ncbi:uncharacterized protein LOC110188211 [Drosophila serrata]|uniref:uncharacterized protein LOC110188211 n=1 Tax=Drosophila serrata TaxID=7274 RepID=UPI000A1CF9D1|nr:uncharacterized protein LOC110188211 [Drosophila serrata]
MSFFSAPNALGRIINPGETDNPLDMSREPLVNEERLETLVYHRSKQWSSLMKNWTDGDEGQELCVSDLEEIFKDEHEDPEMDDEEAIEDPVPETKVDMANISASMGVAELTLILCASEDNEAKAEMQEILNQTMPVVQEHKRKWKEAGLDRILDTFDEKQIEQHVGQWMRRNNSAFVEEAPPAKFLYVLDQASISEVSDNESLHSIDTARYIRQSRRRVPKKISNTATIKMYRTHSHKRDELRAKYAYDDEQEHRHHMQTLLHRRREKERQVTYVNASPQHCMLSSGHHPRRKHRRKRHASSPVFDFSSSDEDDRSYGRCACRSCMSHHSLSRSASYQCYSYRGPRDCHHHHRSVASRTMHHLRRQHTFDIDMDLRPRMRENECNCCTSDRLCSNVVHIANSSTEEWVVENCSPLVVETPKNYRRQQKQKHQLVAITKSNSKSALSKCHKQRLPKSLKTVTAPKLLKAQVSLLGDTSDDEVEDSPRIRKIKPVASAPVTARKILKAAPSTFKQKLIPPKQDKGLINLKINPADIVQSSDETEDEVQSLVAKNSKKESGSVSSFEKKTPSSNKPIYRTTNRLSKIPEEVTRPKDPEDENPASSTKICKEKETCLVEKASSKALETNSKQLLDEQKTHKKLMTSNLVPVVSSESNEFGTSTKSRGRPKKIATLNEGPIDPNTDIVQSSDESEDEVKGRSRLVSFSTSKQLKATPGTVKVAVESSPPKKGATSSKSRGRQAKCPAAPTRKKRTPMKTSSSAGAKDNAAIPSPDSQEIVAEKIKASKAKTSNRKSKKVKSSDSASLDKATDSDESDFQRALALSAETYKDEQLKRAGDSATPPENQPQSQSQSQSQLMFNNNSVACNSTALANDTACSRVLSPLKCGSKRAAAVSSTEAQRAEVINLNSSEECLVKKGAAPGADADCTVVTSTTICEPPAAVSARKPPPLKISKRGILLHNSSSAGEGSNFTLTEQSLGEVIGERFARRYLKYHVGSRTFDSSHSVYYRPTAKLAEALKAASMDTQLLADLSTSGSSDDDVFDQIHKYGDVYSVAENAVKHKD